MNIKRRVSRRSFLAAVGGSAVAGGALLAVRGEASALQATDSDPSDPVGRGRGGSRSGVTDGDPSDPVGRGRGGTRSGTSDSDPSDPIGRGRGTGARSGHTDGDPTDPIGNGRGGGTRSGLTDSDPTDPSGNGRRGRSGCSDSDPTDRGGDGRNCGTRGSGGGGGPHQTGRRERRYEVCWVDHPSRTNDECNIQTYSEWQTTWSDGRVDYDTSESQARRAEMEARGYTARWHRMTVNDWVGQ